MIITSMGGIILLLHMQGAKIALSALAQALSLLTEQQSATRPTQLYHPAAYPPLHPLSLTRPHCQILSSREAQWQLPGALRPPPGLAWISLQLSRQDTVSYKTGSTKQTLLHQDLFRPCMLCCCLIQGGIDLLGVHIK